MLRSGAFTRNVTDMAVNTPLKPAPLESKSGRIIDVQLQKAVILCDGEDWTREFSLTHWYSGWPVCKPKVGDRVSARLNPDGELLSVRKVNHFKTTQSENSSPWSAPPRPSPRPSKTILPPPLPDVPRVRYALHDDGDVRSGQHRIRALAVHSNSPCTRNPRKGLMMRDITFEVKFEPRDVWVGLFWDRRLDGTHIYICPVPLLVLHWVIR